MAVLPLLRAYPVSPPPTPSPRSRAVLGGPGQSRAIPGDPQPSPADEVGPRPPEPSGITQTTRVANVDWWAQRAPTCVSAQTLGSREGGPPSQSTAGAAGGSKNTTETHRSARCELANSHIHPGLVHTCTRPAHAQESVARVGQSSDLLAHTRGYRAGSQPRLTTHDHRASSCPVLAAPRDERPELGLTPDLGELSRLDDVVVAPVLRGRVGEGGLNCWLQHLFLRLEVLALALATLEL